MPRKSTATTAEPTKKAPQDELDVMRACWRKLNGLSSEGKRRAAEYLLARVNELVAAQAPLFESGTGNGE